MRRRRERNSVWEVGGLRVEVPGALFGKRAERRVRRRGGRFEGSRRVWRAWERDLVSVLLVSFWGLDADERPHIGSLEWIRGGHKQVVKKGDHA